jgi:hypothetical protein
MGRIPVLLKEYRYGIGTTNGHHGQGNALNQIIVGVVSGHVLTSDNLIYLDVPGSQLRERLD